VKNVLGLGKNEEKKRPTTKTKMQEIDKEERKEYDVVENRVNLKEQAKTERQIKLKK